MSYDPGCVVTNDGLLSFTLSDIMQQAASKDGNLRKEVDKLFSKIQGMDSIQIRSPKGVHFEKLKQLINKFSLRATKFFRFHAFESPVPHPQHPNARYYIINKFDTEHYKKGFLFHSKLLQKDEL
jgi:hypothetical protein